MEPFRSAEQLRDAFGISGTEIYQEFIPFTDGKPGFSIKRRYPNNIPFKPPVKKDGSPDVLAMIRVLYNPKGLSDTDINLNKVPLWIDISKHSKYGYKHFGYDFKDEDCPTRESLLTSQSTPHPADLQFQDDFFFDHIQNQFVNKTGHRLRGQEVLQAVFDEHCSTTRGVRRKVWLSIAQLGWLCDDLLRFLEITLRFCFRKYFDNTRNPLRPLRKEDILLLEADSLEIFGYKTSKNVILTYASLVLMVYAVSFGLGLPQGSFLASIWNHPFLALCATLVTLPLLEYLGPQAIRLLSNVLRKVRYWSIMHSPLYEEVDRKRKERR